MKFRRCIHAILVCAAAALVCSPAAAHHSTTMFEWGKEQTLVGTIDSFEWTQPHSWIWFKVPGEGGKVEQWGLEGMSPSWLARHGWDRHALKSGDQVRIVIYPLRDGRRGGFAVRVTFADGRTLEQLPQRKP